jgi:RimJ/RimL family protein N-acetyltransferase
MVFRPDYPVTTERLRLRPYDSSDLASLYDIYRRPDVAQYLYWEPVSRREAKDDLRRRLAQTAFAHEGDRLTLAVCIAADGTHCGDVTLKWTSETHRQGELGFVVHPDHQGQGFATEASAAILGIGFDLIGLHRIIGRCDARNVPSARVLQRLGMRQEAHFRHNEVFKGEWGDELVFALLEDEWRTIRTP